MTGNRSSEGHGLYDLSLNIGYIHIGTSHETGEFACDAIRQWWQQHGSAQYATASSILLLCDGSGSNSARQYLFNQDLQALVNELGIESLSSLHLEVQPN